MNRRARDDLIVIGAGLAGLAVGQIIVERMRGRAGPRAPSAVSAARLASAIALSARIADAARFGRPATGGRAAMAFVVGAGSIVARPMLSQLLRAARRTSIA